MNYALKFCLPAENKSTVFMRVPLKTHCINALPICTKTIGFLVNGEEPGLVDRVLALHAGSRGFDSHSCIRVAVGDCSVTERRRWRPPYRTGKTVHVHAKHYKHN